MNKGISLYNYLELNNARIQEHKDNIYSAGKIIGCKATLYQDLLYNQGNDAVEEEIVRNKIADLYRDYGYDLGNKDIEYLGVSLVMTYVKRDNGVSKPVVYLVVQTNDRQGNIDIQEFNLTDNREYEKFGEMLEKDLCEQYRVEHHLEKGTDVLEKIKENLFGKEIKENKVERQSMVSFEKGGF